MKKYILSIEQETKEYFDETVKLIKDRIKAEVLNTPLISNNLIIFSIIENEMNKFADNIVALLDFYTDGIYNSGKLVSRNKLKLKKLEAVVGEKYSFNHNDLLFIERYKSIKLSAFGSELNKSITSYLEYLITNSFNVSEENDFSYSNQIVDNKSINKINSILEDGLLSLYDELVELIVSEILVLFKRAQVEEYKNLGVEVVTFLSQDDVLSCPYCMARTGKILPINKVTDDFGIVEGLNHAFCKYSIDPVISYKNQLTDLKMNANFGIHTEFNEFVSNHIHLSDEINTKVNINIGNIELLDVPIEIEYRINKLLSKVNIKKFIVDKKTIKFIDNITDLDGWVDSVKQHYLNKGQNDFEASTNAMKAQDILKYKISTFNYQNILYISHSSLDSQPIENIIVRELIKDKVEVDEWIINRFNEKKETKNVGHGVALYADPFISYLAEESVQNYLIESVVYYINLPNKLEVIDEEMFNHIKDDIMQNIKVTSEESENYEK